MNPVLSVENLEKSFATGPSGLLSGLFGTAPRVAALRGVSFQVARGETLGIVGESGCGKSTLARMIVGLSRPSGGQIRLADPEPGAPGSPPRRGGDRLGTRIQYVFQDPISSLNPRKTIRQSLEVAPRLLRGLSRTQTRARIEAVLEAVNLRPEFLERYPHEFSGGQAQRIGIARALLAEPEILVLDEPVSALDVSVQAQVLRLLAQIKQERALTYLFISHDLAVVEAISTRVMVLYFGSVVEMGPAERIFARPAHPYTRLLADSLPGQGGDVGAQARKGLASELPDPLAPPPGCAFAGRCGRATDLCRSQAPVLQPLQEGSLVACHHPLSD